MYVQFLTDFKKRGNKQFDCFFFSLLPHNFRLGERIIYQSISFSCEKFLR